jgi:hypothetical protein
MKFSVLVLFIALFALINPAIAAESSGPKIKLPETTYEFPQAREDEKLIHNFVVINEGDKPLLIEKVSTSWGCTAVKFDRQIDPGKEGKVSLEVKTANMNGNFRKTATIFSNAVNSEKVMLSLTGNVKPYILVKPRRSVYLLVKPGQTARKTLTVQAQDGEEVKLLGGKTGLEDVIKFKIKEVQPNKQYQVIVENKTEKIGKYGGYLELFTSNEKKPIIKIRVSVDIQGEIIASPPGIVFGNIDPKKSPGTVFKRKTFIRRQDLKEFQLAGAKYDEKRYDVQIKELQKGKVYEAEIFLRPEGFKKGAYDDVLLLKTNVESQPVVKIPIKVSIR